MQKLKFNLVLSLRGRLTVKKQQINSNICRNGTVKFQNISILQMFKLYCGTTTNKQREFIIEYSRIVDTQFP